ncbi:MAG: hypothetical protein NTW87_30800 [Planctomycetota bacterium]|nr:hypothetical protein [Planctomycetota bacterium]
MAIVVSCQCGRKFQTKDEYAGRQARCPACGKVLMIPESDVEVMTGDEPAESGEDEGGAYEQEAAPAPRRRQREQPKLLSKGNLIAAGSLLLMVAIASSVYLVTRHEEPTAPPPGLPSGPISDPTPQKQNTPPPEARPLSLPPPPTGDMDDVERYIQWAIQTKDSALKANALAFKPDDPRLQFDSIWRKPSPAQQAAFKAKTAMLAGVVDLELGPKPAPATDAIEARMLMDPDLVGSAICVNTIGGRSILYVFVDPCNATIADVVKKYGAAAAPPMPSGDSKIHFYGRVAVVEGEGGKVLFIARRHPKD